MARKSLSMVIVVKEVRELAGSRILDADLPDPEGNLIQLLEVRH